MQPKAQSFAAVLVLIVNTSGGLVYTSADGSFQENNHPFPPDLHERLSRLAARKGSSLAELVRSACEKQYGIVSSEDRLEAVRSRAALELPVGNTAEMKLDSVPEP